MCLPAAVYVGATLDEPGVVSHAAPARISIGARQGFDDRRLAAIHETLAATGQVVQVSPDIQRERWRKLMWNASFNTVSAVTMRTPAELLALPETRALLVAIMSEVAGVARAQGIDLQRSRMSTSTSPGPSVPPACARPPWWTASAAAPWKPMR